MNADQGLDTNEKTGASLAASLTEEGYGRLLSILSVSCLDADLVASPHSSQYQGFACYKCEEADVWNIIPSPLGFGVIDDVRPIPSSGIADAGN